MNWATPFDHIWHSPSFAIGLTLAAAAFFGIIVLIALLRAERSVATGALTVITLVAIGFAVTSMLHGPGPAVRSGGTENRSSPVATASLPAMSCIDDIAGDTVGQACEKALFGSAESTAAAVNYMAAMITRLTALGDATTAQRSMTPEIQALRRAVEHDRYGLVAQVLLARDRCTPTACPAYRSLTDNHQIITNMDEHLYDGLVARYAPSWNAPLPAVTAALPGGLLGASVPTGRPTNAEFPSAANTPAVSIMTPEPGTGTGPAGARPASGAAGGQTAPARAAQTAGAPAPSPTPAPAAKKQSAAKKTAPAAPVQISPGAQAPAASED
jgi:hypothetical protein